MWRGGILAVGLAGAGLAALAAAAEAPRLLSFEGRLLRSDGAPETGQVTLVFKLYEAETDAVAPWTESHTIFLGAGGYYAVHLGSSTMLPAFDGREWWLGVTVVNESEMRPRSRLVSVPYALHSSSAENAQRLAGEAATEYLLRSSPLNASNLLAGEVPSGRLPLAVPLLSDDQLTDRTTAARGVALLDPVTGRLADTYLPAGGAAAFSETTDLADGKCAVLRHGFGTFAVLAQVWMDSGSEMVPAGDIGGAEGFDYINLAGKSCSASGWVGSNTCEKAYDGSFSNVWWSDTALGWWSVSLGYPYLIDRVAVYAQGMEYHWTSWDVMLSADGVSFFKVATATCVVGSTCQTYVESTFSPAGARHVRIEGVTASGVYGGLAEVKVHGARRATVGVTLPNPDHVALCNFQGATRRFLVVVSR